MKDNAGDGVFYSYTTNMNGVEEENKFLRESVQNLEKEIEKFKKNPLLVCDVKDLLDDKAVIRL